mmetsp:Transcript_6175/g.20622  ORF Transcript_6175/g.20622 Transcript_6175/m.20622 type:complete len:426 (-) Transcript_6175:153-1430(-)
MRDSLRVPRAHATEGGRKARSKQGRGARVRGLPQGTESARSAASTAPRAAARRRRRRGLLLLPALGGRRALPRGQRHDVALCARFCSLARRRYVHRDRRLPRLPHPLAQPLAAGLHALLLCRGDDLRLPRRGDCRLERVLCQIALRGLRRRPRHPLLLRGRRADGTHRQLRPPRPRRRRRRRRRARRQRGARRRGVGRGPAPPAPPAGRPRRGGGGHRGGRPTARRGCVARRAEAAARDGGGHLRRHRAAQHPGGHGNLRRLLPLRLLGVAPRRRHRRAQHPGGARRRDARLPRDRLPRPRRRARQLVRHVGAIRRAARLAGRKRALVHRRLWRHVRPDGRHDDLRLPVGAPPLRVRGARRAAQPRRGRLLRRGRRHGEQPHHREVRLGGLLRPRRRGGHMRFSLTLLYPDAGACTSSRYEAMVS